MTASAGIALVTRREQPPAEEILRNADIALYRAKDEGAGRYRLFEERMHAALLRRMELEAELRRAIAAGQFILHYQPIVDADGGAVVGAEALVRWEHPEHGLIPPGQFIAVAEQAGLIELLGSWILREAVRQAAEWHRAGVGGGKLWISVNLSVEQLANPALVGEVELALRDHGLRPSCSCSSSPSRPSCATFSRRTAWTRSSLGVRIAVDDFGEGHSSLAYLASLPLDLLKIPKTFVDQLGGRAPTSRSCARSSSSPARSGCAPWRRGSRSPTSSRRSWSSAATSPRASCSPAPARPRTSRRWRAGRCRPTRSARCPPG